MIPNKYKHLSQVDILSIGAGATSLYLGVKLKESNSGKKMVIVEQTPRVGGMIQSLELTDGGDVKAEKCALHFFPGQDYVAKALEKYNIGVIEYSNQKAATFTPVPFMDLLLKRIPPTDPYLITYSNLAEIVRTPTIKRGDYNHIYRLEGGTGFANDSNMQSLFYLYNFLAPPPSPVQYFVDGGFMNLIDHMHEDIKDEVDIFLNTKIDSIIYAQEIGKYIVNDKWATNKIVYTGSIGDMVQLGTNSAPFMESRNLVLDYMGTYARYMRLYLVFEDPWWTEEDLMLYFHSFNIPIGTLFYYSHNTVLIYADMTRADILHELIPESMRDVKDPMMKWMDPEKYTDLVFYALHIMTRTISEAITQDVYPGLKMPTTDQLEDISHLAYAYTEESVINYKRMRLKQWENYFPTINNNGNIHFLSSNYHHINASVDACFECVEDNLANVLA